MNISDFNDWLASKEKESLIMGILNVTPDSFSDGGLYFDTQKAINHALSMIEDGADIIDIGGESTRPFSDPVSVDDELLRVIPVVKELRKRTDTVISIDTTKSTVAKEACLVGADIINDISGMLFDAEMIDVAKDIGCPVVLMHIKGNPKTMQENPTYDNVVSEIKCHLLDRIDYVIENGIDKKNIILDPGIGFGKTIENNFEILNRLDELTSIEYPFLIGVSNKSFIGKTLNINENDRLQGTIVANTIALQKGCKIFRVHNVKEAKRCLLIANKIFNSDHLNN
ncbi:MAG: dihydropteroate synthase [Candidatus Neomarinimicrobiota bacterium]|nr:dihydropteroate synthase [Candidatus Neomarinimicrobiota bacterium]